jgi:hypothetical protein
MFKLLILLLISVGIFANTYHIEDLSEPLNINKAFLTKLKKNKIKTTDDFLIINKTSKQRAINSKKYSINIQELTTLLSIFDLIRIKGVGPTAAKLLIKADIKSIRDFQNMDIKKVEEKLIKMNEKFKISPFTPNKENLDVWKNLSQKLKIIIL